MIAILAGSSRVQSKTSRVALAVRRICLNVGIDAKAIYLPDFTKYDIPFYNQGGLHRSSLTHFQQKVFDAMASSRIIFFLTPEYNWFPSAEIINLINQFGNRNFSECWNEKLFATCGISSGRGGRIPGVQLSYVLNKLINAMDFQSIVSAKMFESQFTAQVLDEQGNSLGNAEYDAGLEKFVNYNLGLLNRVLL